MPRLATDFLCDVIDNSMIYFKKSVDPFIIEQCKDIKNIYDATHISLRKRTKLLVKIATKIKNYIEKNPTCEKYISEVPIPSPIGYYYFFCVTSSSDGKNGIDEEAAKLHNSFPNDFMLAKKIINQNNIPLVYKIFIFANAIIIDMPPSMVEVRKHDKKMNYIIENDYAIKE